MPDTPDAPCTVYVTAPNGEEARAIARNLLDRRLCACANILPAMTALYWWQGEIQEDAEVAILLKTQRRHIDALSQAIKALHSYDVPCIVVWPIVAGDPDYLTWLNDQVCISPSD